MLEFIDLGDVLISACGRKDTINSRGVMYAFID